MPNLNWIKRWFSFNPPTPYGGGALFSTPLKDEKPSSKKIAQERIRFDNTIRIVISLPSFLVCFGLWAVEALPTLLPLAVIFVAHGAIQAIQTFAVRKLNYPRWMDFSLCAVDVIGISLAIYFTGGISSPLYFLYFILILIKAFHRDWELLLFSGYGGLICYAGALLVSLETPWGTTQLVDLGGRIFFMATPVAVASLVVSLMGKKEVIEKRRFDHMRNVTRISHLLNSVGSETEIPAVAESIVSLLNKILGKKLNAWARVFLTSQNGKIMEAIQDSSNIRFDLEEELTTDSCPVMQSGQLFQLKNAGRENACPTESFSFKSHVCLPIGGINNETFGVLFVGSFNVNAFDQEEVEFLRYVGRSLGLTVQRLKKFGELNKSVELDSCATATFMASSKSAEETYKAILNGVSTLLSCDQTSLMLWSHDEGILKTVDVKGPVDSFERRLQFSLSEGIPGRVFETGRRYWTTDVEDEFRPNDKPAPFRSLLCLPFTSMKGEQLGVINVWNADRVQAYSREELDAISTFIMRAAAALENVIQFRQHQPTDKDQNEPRAA